ncbi:MAG: N-acetylmuramoyl-L-alanine amidase [Bdellovibrionales bacterium]|nr:N-acetylmuramoyl-L-alanine amidase [Bdellovibrionales bacterium]
MGKVSNYFTMKWGSVVAALVFTCFSSWAGIERPAANVASRYYTPLGARAYSIDPSFPKLGWPFGEPDEEVPDSLVPNFKRRFRVLLDPGHGGHDKGARSETGLLEKDLCLEVASRVAAALNATAKIRGVPMDLKLSRSSDRFVTLRDRVLTANEWQADLFISIHANAAPSPAPSGFEIYFLSTEASDTHTRYLAEKENAGEEAVPPGVLSILSDLHRTNHIQESGQLARQFFRRLSRSLRPNVRGVRQGPFTVLNGTEMPAILIEIGYLTNERDAAELARQGYLNRLVGAISSSIFQTVAELRRLG